MCRSRATGDEAVLLDEARRRLDAAATNLAAAALGEADGDELLCGAIRLVDTANQMIERATEQAPA